MERTTIYRINESHIRNVVRSVLNEVLGDEYQTPDERVADKQREHTRGEWLRGKLDDIRHGISTTFGNEMSDEEYFNSLNGLNRQYRMTGDPSILDKAREIERKYGRGYARRNFGYYRGKDDVRNDTGLELAKNAENKMRMIKSDLNLCLSQIDSNDAFERYESAVNSYMRSGVRRANMRSSLGNYQGYQGGIVYYFATNSNGEPFFLPNKFHSNGRSIIDICTNDELYTYCPRDRRSFEWMKRKSQ